MAATDSFISTARLITAATGIIMATDSFTGLAHVVTSASAAMSEPIANSVFTPRGWRIKVTPAGYLSITKASTFGGVQVAVSFPVKLEDARDLATALMNATT